ncbi:zinc finger protein 354A-like [Folsomia candida]|uniref:zinc finger protein 354A-like n=1 Tax=Folsomia candida TaxID=158441 RepID=UPI00160523ED|nr:zinc finger protein 354A-like [Folsomia candida]XP_035711660.1 zinc finger protein 354A-like [Folsomia candida]
MSEGDGFSKSTKNGTSHILQDLLSSTVLLSRANFVPTRNQKLDNFPVKIEPNLTPPEVTCSICSESTNLLPLAVQEMEILAKFVLSQEHISLILQTEDHPPIFCCKICSSAILSLAKLSTQIENITISLRAVISSRNGLFNKLRSGSKTIEPSRDGEDFGVRHGVTLLHNGDHPGPTESVYEEFSVKVEPPDDHDQDDHEIESDADSALSEPKSPPERTKSWSKYVCKICQPNVTFRRVDNLTRHMNQKHAPKRTTTSGFTRRCPGVERPHGCPKCDKRFIRGPSLRKHFRAVHEGLRVKRKCTLCPEVFSSIAMVRKHMQKFHHVVQPTSKRTPCEMCTKTFSNSTGLHRHVELFHFTDRKSCPYGCATRFTSGADWLKHLEECKSPKMITKIGCYCLFCKTTFRNMLLRMEHYLREHPDKSYPCSHCGAQFSRRNALYYHRCDKYGGNQG